MAGPAIGPDYEDLPDTARSLQRYSRDHVGGFRDHEVRVRALESWVSQNTGQMRVAVWLLSAVLAGSLAGVAAVVHDTITTSAQLTELAHRVERISERQETLAVQQADITAHALQSSASLGAEVRATVQRIDALSQDVAAHSERRHR